jgi:hypothetical protein
MLEAAYTHADGVEGRRSDPEGLPQLVPAGQTEVVAQSPSMMPGNSIEMPLTTKIPTAAQIIPSKPSPRPTATRKSTKHFSTILSFPLFFQVSKNTPGRSNEGITIERVHSTTVATPRTCPGLSPDLVASP